MKSVSIYIMAFILTFVGTGCSHKTVTIPKKSDSFKPTKHTSGAWHKASMKSYKVLGKRYYPCKVKKGYKMHGISSWYGPNFHGKRTSNGEIYNMYKRTAAHKTLPMDTIVKVTNRQNGKSTIVRINDRGPFVKGRIIDCSYKAGKELGLDKMGIAKVDLEVLSCPLKKSLRKKYAKSKRGYSKIDKLSSNFGVQLGAFSELLGAQKYKYLYAQRYSQYQTVIKKVHTKEGWPLYRVWMIGFKSEEAANAFKVKMHGARYT